MQTKNPLETFQKNESPHYFNYKMKLQISGLELHKTKSTIHLVREELLSLVGALGFLVPILVSRQRLEKSCHT
jgi:hypothetical protein